MKKLYFMRHGLTEMNVAGVWSGTTETALTSEGREQAKLAGKQAKSLNIDTIVCSTLGRAKETAEIVAKAMGYPLDKIVHSSLLIERHFGVLEGQPYKPDFNFDGIADVETTDTLIHRARLALEWIESLDGETILVVSHGSLGRALRHAVHEHIPFEGAGKFNNAEIITLRQTL